MEFSLVNGHTLYSGSWDHSIRSWDIAQESNVSTVNCETVVLDLKECPFNAGIIASAGADSVVRLWDCRTVFQDMRLGLSSHTNWVSCVAWSPENGNHIASGGYDGKVKVWDIRSCTRPLHSISGVDQVDQKVFCLDWSASGLVSGSQDGKMRSHTFAH